MSKITDIVNAWSSGALSSSGSVESGGSVTIPLSLDDAAATDPVLEVGVTGEDISRLLCVGYDNEERLKIVLRNRRGNKNLSRCYRGPVIRRNADSSDHVSV